MTENDGNLQVGTVSTGDGDVFITAEGSIELDNANSLVTGNLVQLESRTGGIGTAGEFLRIDSGAKGLQAVAAGDIFLREIDDNNAATNDDLNLISVESIAGNVTIDVQAGRLLDNNQQQERDTRTEETLLNLCESVGGRPVDQGRPGRGQAPAPADESGRSIAPGRDRVPRAHCRLVRRAGQHAGQRIQNREARPPIGARAMPLGNRGGPVGQLRDRGHDRF